VAGSAPTSLALGKNHVVSPDPTPTINKYMAGIEATFLGLAELTARLS
jgi:hypothetical protein